MYFVLQRMGLYLKFSQAFEKNIWQFKFNADSQRNKTPESCWLHMGLEWLSHHVPSFFMVIQIQDKLFFSMSGPPSDMETLLESGIFDDVGKSKEFRHCSFYVRGE